MESTMQMKHVILFIVTIAVSSIFGRAQSDTINRVDSNNKRIGWWKVYLDKDLAVTEDSTKASYFKYSYFEGKFDYYSTSRFGSEKNPVITSYVGKTSDIIQALDGEYKVNFSNGQPRFILLTQNGKLLEYKEFYKNGKVKHAFDYTESCGDTPFHYCIYFYNEDGSLKMKTSIRSPKK